jgi:hypothetical protein
VVKRRPVVIIALTCAALAATAVWVAHARLVGYWLQVHTGTINEAGPYYGFWSGFGSDLHHKAHDHRTAGQAAAHDPPGDARHDATRPGATRTSD